MAATTTEILVLVNEPSLRAELETACEALGELRPRLRFVEDRGQLLETVRSRPPDLVLAELGQQPELVNRLARDLAGLHPPVPLAAAFRPHGLGDDMSESAVLIGAMRSGVRDFLRRPISTAELRTLLSRISQTQDAPARATRPAGKVVSFISNKGGVGKSTLAVNTAVGLARRRPERVLLIDASLQMGVAAPLLDLRPTATLADVARERDRLDETMIRQLAATHESGLHLLAAPQDAVEALEVDDTLVAQLLTLARRSYDFVIVDTFPMFDRVVVAVLDLSDRAYVVLENVVPTLLGAAKLLSVLERLGFPRERQQLIVNRYQRMADGLSLDDVASRLERPIEHVLPFDKRVISAANTGLPIAGQPLRWGGFSRELQRLVLQVDAMTRVGSNGQVHQESVQ